jgi:NitT/TauT family transport system permease protein
MLSQSLKHAMSIYVFWLIVFFSAFTGIMSTNIITWIQNMLTPEIRAMKRQKRYKKA